MVKEKNKDFMRRIRGLKPSDIIKEIEKLKIVRIKLEKDLFNGQNHRMAMSKVGGYPISLSNIKKNIARCNMIYLQKTRG